MLINKSCYYFNFDSGAVDTFYSVKYCNLFPSKQTAQICILIAWWLSFLRRKENIWGLVSKVCHLATKYCLHVEKYANPWIDFPLISLSSCKMLSYCISLSLSHLQTSAELFTCNCLFLCMLVCGRPLECVIVCVYMTAYTRDC